MKQDESLFLRFLYNTLIGRIFLKILSSKMISIICGIFLDSKISKILIKPFAKKNNIKFEDYYCEDLKSFNDFFSRKIHEELRPIDNNKNHLISPCDGLLSAYNIKKDTILPVKQSKYTITSLLNDDNLASIYENGICLVFRLCVNHYHRYCYIDNGKKGKNVYIPGKLHTVRPIALERFPVFIQNSREYTTLNTENFGKVTQMEVGALLVGKIKNYHEEAIIHKGEEKGTFLYGGSTIILLFEKDKVEIPKNFFDKTMNNQEIDVKMGEKIGEIKN